MTPKKPRKKVTATGATVVLALAAGAAGGRATAPTPDAPATDPLGDWHYAPLPLQVCTSIEGAGIGRVSVRPEVVTANGTRVNVPEFRIEGPDWWLCAADLTVDTGGAPQASDRCYRRDGSRLGDLEVTLGGRPVARTPVFPPCTLSALDIALKANPISGVKP